MQDYTELLWYLAPPAREFPLSLDTGRRRLFGGDYPEHFVGDSFRIFGGNDYGYVIPRTAFGGDMEKIKEFTRKNTYLGFAITAALAIGNGMMKGAWKSIKILTVFIIANELFSWWQSGKTSKVTFQQILDGFRELERTTGLGLDAGKPVMQLAVERHFDIQAGKTRYVSGSSMLYCALAGFGISQTGLVLLEALFWPPVGGKNALLTYGVSNYVLLNNLWMYYQDQKNKVNSGIAHNLHAGSMIFGWGVGWTTRFWL